MRVLFIGTGEIGVPTLRWLIASPAHQLVGVVTQPDKPVGREQRIEPTPIKAALADAPVPLLQPEKIRRDEVVAQLRALHPDVVVVMAYGQILPRSVLEIPRLACLNLHASLLPKHRGAAPIQAAIAAGDRETGVTVMFMDEGLDTGDILLARPRSIAPHETGGSLHDRLGEIAPAALDDALRMLEQGTAPRRPQNSDQVSYAPKLQREDGRIDWQQSAARIERTIRAYDPWPGAYLILKDESGRERKLKILSSDIAADVAASPGELRLLPERGLVCGAKDGAILLREVQLEGKKRMPASDLIRGHPWLASAAMVAK